MNEDLDKELMIILERFGADVQEVTNMKTKDWTFKLGAAYKSLHKAKNRIKKLYAGGVLAATKEGELI